MDTYNRNPKEIETLEIFNTIQQLIRKNTNSCLWELNKLKGEQGYQLFLVDHFGGQYYDESRSYINWHKGSIIVSSESDHIEFLTNSALDNLHKDLEEQLKIVKEQIQESL